MTMRQLVLKDSLGRHHFVVATKKERYQEILCLSTRRKQPVLPLESIVPVGSDLQLGVREEPVLVAEVQVEAVACLFESEM